MSRRLLAAWEPVYSSLLGLGFDPAAHDPWQALGIVPIEGPRPSTLMIEQRFALAQLLLSAAQHASWREDDRQKAEDTLSALDVARFKCAEGLPAMLKRRPRLQQGRSHDGLRPAPKVYWLSGARRKLKMSMSPRNSLKFSAFLHKALELCLPPQPLARSRSGYTWEQWRP